MCQQYDAVRHKIDSIRPAFPRQPFEHRASNAQESARLMCQQYDAARYEMASHAGRTALRAAIADGAAPLQLHWLQDRIAAPLGKSFGATSDGLGS